MMIQIGKCVRFFLLQVMLDEATDELASYFNRETLPKLLITTCDRPGAVSYKEICYRIFFTPELKYLLSI